MKTWWWVFHSGVVGLWREVARRRHSEVSNFKEKSVCSVKSHCTTQAKRLSDECPYHQCQNDRTPKAMTWIRYMREVCTRNGEIFQKFSEDSTLITTYRLFLGKLLYMFSEYLLYEKPCNLFFSEWIYFTPSEIYSSYSYHLSVYFNRFLFLSVGKLLSEQLYLKIHQIKQVSFLRWKNL